ncbi:unnamed protein product [Moneuplotes crassus]|uniref:Uncharacterized protein n=1 Tax=Euplotes crassus TaxID=5936 RepID=A0AAD2D510_EUPCR|nr:unnamed protein product [Moneuplotes crassus]
MCTGRFRIRRLKKFLCCISIPTGARIVILIETFLFMFQIFWINIRLFGSRTIEEGNHPEGGPFRDRVVNCDYDMFGLGYDVLCNLHNGKINSFSLVFVFAQLLFHAGCSILGIFTWAKKFNLRVFEKFFYVYFILLMFSFINIVVFSLIVLNEWYYILFRIGIKAVQVFYLISVIFSYLMIVDKEYREMRKFGIKARKESLGYCQFNDTSNSIQL